MEISVNAAITAAVMQKQANVHQQVQVSMLKKSIDTQAQNALTLIADLPQVTTPQPVGSLGHNIDIKA